MGFKGRDIVSIDDFSKTEIEFLLKQARTYQGKDMPFAFQVSPSMAYAFFESSTGTRMSFMQASSFLNINRFGFSKAEGTSSDKNESLHDTIMRLTGNRADVLVMRHKKEGSAQYVADFLDIPVINAGDGANEHPTQTFLDLLSIQETQAWIEDTRGGLNNLKVAFVGDLKYGRTVHSLIKALRLFDGNQFYVIHPEQLGLPETYQGDDVRESSLDEVLNKCNIIYMTRTQLDRINGGNTDTPREQREEEIKRKIRLVPEMFYGLENQRLKVLHPLPIDKAEPTIDRRVYKDPQSKSFAYFYRQSNNGLPTRMAELAAVLGHYDERFKRENPEFEPPKAADKVENGSLCQNKECITQDEDEEVPRVFRVKGREPDVQLSCHYCKTPYINDT